jgi:hypothetical protein
MGAAVLEGGGEEQMTAVARHGTARLQVAAQRWLAARQAAAHSRG